MSIQPWGLEGLYVVVSTGGLFLTRNLVWTHAFTPEALFHSWREAWSAVAQIQG